LILFSWFDPAPQEPQEPQHDGNGATPH